ncbi:MAG TPA: hypothetical protein VFX97_20595 [Pyrinomonadaceae bacterium]|nr:hypothetical protein [Pyrinomonadaceae bacterium]
MAIVVPAKGKLKETARVLLDLADNPRDVRTTGNGTEFEVPDELADRYHGRDPVHTPVSADKTPDAAPARPVKRRGRAPRVDMEG